MNCKECGQVTEFIIYGRCKPCRMKWAKQAQIGRKVMRVVREMRAYCPDCEGPCKGHGE